MKSHLVYIIIFFQLVFPDIVVQQQNRVCPSISVKNGKVTRRRQRGRFVKFSCNHGYLLAGEKHSTCVRGKWDPEPPKCVRATCMNKVQSPVNGLIYPSHNGAALHFFCRQGYVLRGPADVYCDGKKWDTNAPTCVAENQRPKLFCDFEDIDICGWTPDLNHDFDWKRENFNTPSGNIGTGPSFDHTRGFGGDGHYMYIESSSRNENDTAKLISPVFDESDSNVCFEFFYHMFGATIGTLRVYLKKFSDDWDLQPSDAIFSKSGNQGDKWYRAFRKLGVIEEDFQIVIEGIRGSSYVSDIAIDDVKIILNCTEEIENPTTLFSSSTSQTEIIPMVESCEYRCGKKEEKLNDAYHLTCDCDDDCFYHNRCCPDFFDFCLGGSTITEEFTTLNPNETETLQYGTHRATVGPTELIPTTLKIPRHFISTISDSPHFTNWETKPTNKYFSTKYRVNSITTSRFLRPTIYFQTPRSTPIIVRKIFRSTSTSSRTIYPQFTNRPTTIKTTVTPSTSFDFKHFYPIFRPVHPNKEVEKDFEDVTVPKNNDEGLFLTSPLPEYDYSKEYSEELDNIDSPRIQNFSEINKLFSQKAVEISTYNVVLIVVSVTSMIILITALTIFIIIRRYGRPGQRFKCSSNGDSQSDVRFLRSNETLDFNMDNELYGEL